MYLFHNTSDAVLPENNGLYIKAPGEWEIIYARNNIWAGTDYAINNYNTDEPVDLDYDNLFTSNTEEFAYWDLGSVRHMHDLPTFQSLTGQEINGFNELPGFLNANNADYSLALGSPLIDEGVYIPGLTTVITVQRRISAPLNIRAAGSNWLYSHRIKLSIR
jgi:hypothetical protein